MRRWLKWLPMAMVVAGALIVALAFACEPSGSHKHDAYQQRQASPDLAVSSNKQPASRTSLYLPTWLSADQYRQIAGLPLRDSQVDIQLAFAVPSQGSLPAPAIPDGAVAVIRNMAPDADLSVAIGGYGNDKTRQDILKAFDIQTKDPTRFANQASDMVGAVSQRVGRPVNGVDIDWEYPTAAQAGQFADALTALDAKLPKARISVAVPAADNLAGFTDPRAMAAIAKHTDVVHVMTYDQSTPFSGPTKTAGPVATRDWIFQNFQAWQRRLSAAGGQSVAAVGFPGYCYSYKGAQKLGDGFSGGSQILLNKADASKLVRQPDGSSAYVSPDGWTSCFSAEDVKHIIADLPDTKVPAFVWDASGIDAAYLQTLTGR